MEISELTLNQMDELVSIGIDTSSASLYKVVFNETGDEYTILSKNKDNRILNPDIENKEVKFYSVFNLQDLLDMIPNKIIRDGVHTARLIFGKNMIAYEYYDAYKDIEEYIFYSEWGNKPLILCAFEVVKWLKKNKHI